MGTILCAEHMAAWYGGNKVGIRRGRNRNVRWLMSLSLSLLYCSPSCLTKSGAYKLPSAPDNHRHRYTSGGNDFLSKKLDFTCPYQDKTPQSHLPVSFRLIPWKRFFFVWWGIWSEQNLCWLIVWPNTSSPSKVCHSCWVCELCSTSTGINCILYVLYILTGT